MNLLPYLDKFEKCADLVDKKTLSNKSLLLSVGVVLDSVYLKLYKREWANNFNDPLNAEARIFFSVWLNEKTLQQKKVFYNIHALKLRKLNGHIIQSRQFAENFRKRFKKHQNNWKNVSVEFGPLTLMEGWIAFKEENLEQNILHLARNFIEIENLVDLALKEFEK